MGMYTELHFNAELVKNLSEEVVNILNYMVGNNESESHPIGELPPTPDHPLFSTNRWDFMLRCDSYYFPADTHSTLRFDDISEAYYLCIRSNLKNYDGEIGKFLTWIMPYVAEFEGDFLGYFRYEENKNPTLIYKDI